MTRHNILVRPGGSIDPEIGLERPLRTIFAAAFARALGDT
jgi:hypothetical protein